jgi:hypothetical protein
MSQSCDETCPVWDEKRRKARKARKCGACGEEIRVGDVYSFTSALFDGAWTHYVRCLRCDEMYHFLSNKISRDGDWDEGCAPLLDCGHEYVENWGSQPPPEVVELAFLTRDEAQQKFIKKDGG